MSSPRPRGFEIAPFQGLLYDLAKLNGMKGQAARGVTAPPYDVISPAEHGSLLAASPYNITRITLGDSPGAVSSYEERARLLGRWREEGVLFLAPEPSFYVYVVEYRTPGASASGPGAGGKVRFTGFMALGRLHPFADGVVLPHERTFPKVVDDRLHLLAATRTHLESIFLLYSDPERSLDKLLESLAQGKPLIEVEARPGESHALYPVSDIAVFIRLMDFMSRQRPIIADGHHRYTTSLRYLDEISGADGMQAAAAWQMMTFTNLHGGGLSILATHRLAKLKREAVGDPVAAAWQALLARFEPAGPADADLTLETRDRTVPVRFPASLKAARRGVARTSYALLHDVVFGEWLGGRIDEATGVRYFKEATGEREALARGEGDILFRMKPVDPREFQAVVEGGEVFPHKTTYFYPKLWSGLVLWPIAEPVRLALK